MNRKESDQRRRFFIYWILRFANALKSTDNLMVMFKTGQYLSELEKQRKVVSESGEKGG